MRVWKLVALVVGALVLATGPGAIAGEFAVRAQEVDDRKAVIATVEPVRQLVARARIGGTVAQLSVLSLIHISEPTRPY